MQTIHIFRAGCHIDTNGDRLCFSPQELEKTAAAYSPSTHRAPLVLGHPKTDAPAHGWVTRLEASGGDLVAFVEQVSNDLKEWVRTGRYRAVSASFYLPDLPGNPAPGTYYLRHVGFLGAAVPAVKGLRSPEFAEALAFAQVDIPVLQCCDFAAPAGYSVDPAGLVLHRQAVTYQADHPGVGYMEAVSLVSREQIT